MATHLKEIFPPLILKSSTILPSIYSTLFLKTRLPIAAACSDMEFDPCRSELYLGTTHYFFICLTILAMCKLQAALIEVVMTSSYTAALFEGGKLPSEYGLTAECIYIRETFMKVLRGKKKICYKLIHGLNLTVKESCFFLNWFTVYWWSYRYHLCITAVNRGQANSNVNEHTPTFEIGFSQHWNPENIICFSILEMYVYQGCNLTFCK